MAAPTRDVLVTLPEVQLHKVEAGAESLLEWGPLMVSIVSHNAASQVQCQVGRTAWDLEAAMPTLKAAAHAYTFAIPGTQMFYTVLVAEATPRDLVALLENVLMECTSFQVSGTVSKQDAEQLVDEVAQSVIQETDKVMGPAAGPSSADSTPPGTVLGPPVQYAVGPPRAGPPERILSGASRARDAIASASVWASSKIMEGSQYLITKSKPNEHPVEISPETQARIKQARQVASKGAAIAGTVAAGVADLSVRVANSIVKRMASTDYAKRMTSSDAARVQASREIAAASVVAASEIYESMEQAVKLVFKTTGSASANFVGHKYGPAVGEATRDAAYAAVDVGMIQYSMSKMGMRTVAKRIAKHTAVGMVRTTVGAHPPGAPGGTGLVIQEVMPATIMAPPPKPAPVPGSSGAPALAEVPEQAPASTSGSSPQRGGMVGAHDGRGRGHVPYPQIAGAGQPQGQQQGQQAAARGEYMQPGVPIYGGIAKPSSFSKK